MNSTWRGCGENDLFKKNLNEGEGKMKTKRTLMCGVCWLRGTENREKQKRTEGRVLGNIAGLKIDVYRTDRTEMCVSLTCV